MMETTIHDVYVKITSKKQRDRMKQLCIDNNLNDTIYPTDFEFNEKYKYFTSATTGFYIASFYQGRKKVTEQEFLNLLKCTQKN